MTSRTCRLCLQQKTLTTTLEPGSDLFSNLQICVPEINMYIISNPVICDSCVKLLKMAHAFREQCLYTEKKISNHLENLYLKSIKFQPKQPTPYSFNIDSTLRDYMNESILEGITKQNNTSNVNNNTANLSCTVLLEDVLKTEKIDIADVTLEHDCESEDRDVLSPEQANNELLGGNLASVVANKKLETINLNKTVIRNESIANFDETVSENIANMKKKIEIIQLTTLNKTYKRGRKRTWTKKVKKQKIPNVQVQDVDKKFMSLQICVICEKIFKTKSDLKNHVVEHIHI